MFAAFSRARNAYRLYQEAVAQLATLSDEHTRLKAKLDTAHHELNQARQQRDNYRSLAAQQAAKLESLRSTEQILNDAMRHVTPAPQFTEAQLRTLLQLCHPDKHGGKESAVLITQHINQLRK